ncbi:hypothetical protein HMPREF0765_4347 [Sphingobacterium spiritivorum ATCC 33300]|uniref:DUF5125 domain-containing protein n=1 Tax=Sphingobacterium spiritivorum ATCC 33300 TaxID=525372 RepID=C2G461_SPHSI|nr:DUF5125 domain-containing protein [Sphingobacterium spiritivorum]EEI89979.1 hypothetical protein HMPREF0765_4347 [Sphingobacterium spiritivorum ATCC 33300]QQS94992.1 DUF5125 domain-containing protein [Sphingobacterium spiritivorum]
MKKSILAGFLLLHSVGIFYSCKKDEKLSPGNPEMMLKSELKTALFGDSLSFEVQVSDATVPLSTLKAQLYYTDDQVAETVIRTKENGTYSGKIFIPFYKNVPNGTATLKLVLQNISKTITEQSLDLVVSRPDFPYLTLVAEGKEYKMQKKTANQYAATEVFPFSVKGYIKAPKVGANGNEMNFGWESNAIALGSTSPIPFSNSSSGTYTIAFNTFNYEASPFIIAYAINQKVLNRVNDDNFRTDLTINKGDQVTIDGFSDLKDWWIDPDFFTKDSNGKLTFNAINGNYRITANFPNKYFIVEALDGSNYASLKADGTGAIWIIGEGVGKPSVANNQVGWNTDKALCLAPIGNKKYQVTFRGKETIKLDNINFKFFHQKGWGGEFGSAAIKTSGDLIFIGNGSNGRDSGNLGLLTGKTLEDGKTYVLTVDVSAGNTAAVLTVQAK